MCMLRCTVGMRDWLVYEQSRQSSEYYPSFTLRLLRTQGSRMLENNKTVWWTLLNVALMPTVWRIHQSLCPGIFDFWIDVRIQSKTGFSRFQSSPSVVVEGKRILIYFKRLLVIIGMWISFGCVSVQGMVRMSCLGSALTPLSEHDVSNSLIKNTGGGTVSVIPTENKQIHRVTCFEIPLLRPMMSFTLMFRYFISWTDCGSWQDYIVWFSPKVAHSVISHLFWMS